MASAKNPNSVPLVFAGIDKGQRRIHPPSGRVEVEERDFGEGEAGRFQGKEFSVFGTSAKTDNGLFGIFAKYWQPGEVKTRLAADIGPESAAALHRAFLVTLLQRFEHLPAARVLCYSPSERRGEFAKLAGSGWQLQEQCSGDLGARMAHFFRTAFEQGYERAVLIGSDSPTMPQDSVSQSFDLLRNHRVVLGGCHDGGYYLVGACGEVPPIFDKIPWSGPAVLSETLRRLDTARIPVARVPPWYDVDNLEDLQRLAAELSGMHDDNGRDLLLAVSSALGRVRR